MIDALRLAHTRLPQTLFLLLACATMAGCVGAVSGQAVPREALKSGSSFHVERQPKDSRNLEQNIATAMRSRGLSATSGEPGTAAEDVDYVVTYIDHWMWDMRMYMSDLRIEVRDAESGVIVGYGQSAQSSLKSMGRTHDDVIALALDQLLETAGN